MAFGFIVEKFDLFLAVSSWSVPGRGMQPHGPKFGHMAGLALIVLGTAMIVVAALRFVRTVKAVDSEEVHRPGARFDLALAALLVLLGCALAVYLSHAFVSEV
jgi:uncharacterized membrane protein YidH (DUF202 family)